MYDNKYEHKTVEEYLNLKVRMKNNFNIKKEKKNNRIKYPINLKLEKFVEKIVSLDSINTYGFFNYQFLYEILDEECLPLEYKQLNCRVDETGKMVFYYKNEQILKFVKLLKAAYLNRKIYREFIVIPDVYNMLNNLYDNNIFFFDFLDIEGLSLKEKDLVEILNLLGLLDDEYKDHFYLLSGCSLMVYGLREEIRDVDMVVDIKAFEMLSSKFDVIHVKDNKYRIGNLIEIFLEKRKDFKCQIYRDVLVEDLKTILKFKKICAGKKREFTKSRKDLADISSIQEYMKFHQ